MRTALGRIAGRTMLALAVVTLAGCAAISASSYLERGIDLRQYRTYAWGPADAFSTGDPRLDNNRFFDERVRIQVEKGLANRGFQKATSGEPDLLVRYHARFTEAIETGSIDPSAEYCSQADCSPYVYDAGTLFVYLVDPLTNTMVWRGWAEGRVAGTIDNQESMEARIDETVALILKRLPRSL